MTAVKQPPTSELFFATRKKYHYHWLLPVQITLFNMPRGGAARYVYDDSNPDCPPLENGTITTQDAQSPCFHLEVEPLDTMAGIAIAGIGFCWVLVGIYLAVYHMRHEPPRGPGLRRRRRRRGECSDSGDTEADSTWEVESVLAQSKDAEVPTNNNRVQRPHRHEDSPPPIFIP